MTDETPKTSDTIIAASQQSDSSALSAASVTDKPGDGGVLFDSNGNVIEPATAPEAAPEINPLDENPGAKSINFEPTDAAWQPSQPISAAQGETVDARDTKLTELQSEVEAIKADLLYMRSLYGWPVEEGNKLKAYYHEGLRKLGIGK